MTATLSMPGQALDAAVSRLREELWGGANRRPEEIAAMMTEAGFQAVRAMAAQEPGTAAMSGVIFGRRSPQDQAS